MKEQESRLTPNEAHIDIDLTDAENARKAFIASEIFNRKY